MHFNIELDNPVSILQQEEAKVFFKDKGDEQLYTFFANATLLRIMQEGYADGGNSLSIANDNLTRKEKDLQRQKAEREEWCKKVEELTNIEHNNLKKTEYKKEMKWLLVQNSEKEKAKIESELSEKASKVETLKSSLEAAQEEMDRLGISKDKLSLEVEASKAREEVSRTRIHEARQAHGQAKRKLEETRLAIKTIEDDIGMKRRELKELQNEARAKRMRKESREKDLATRKEELVKQREAHENTSKELEDEIGALGRKRSELQEALSSSKRHFLACKSELQGFQGRRKDLVDELNKLQSADDTSGRNLSRFGRDMQRLADEVAKAVTCGKFKRPPVGPVGRHVKLRGAAVGDSNLADLLESELNQRNLNAFLVDNSHDHKVLDTIFKEVCGGRRVPLAVIMKLDCGTINMDRGRVVTNADMPGVLDFLTFDNDDAFRFIVEETKAEKTIVVSQEKAQVK